MSLILNNIENSSDTHTKKDIFIASLVEYFCYQNHFLDVEKILKDLKNANLIEIIANKHDRELILKSFKKIITNNNPSNLPINYSIPRLHEFNIINKLAETLNGTIYRVKSYIDKKEYALKKVLLYEDLYEPGKYIREIETLASLDHPNVLRYYSSWIQRDIESKYLALFILTEICESDLEEYINNNKLNKKDKKRIVKQIIESIKYIHSNNIIHRDIKPKNILIKKCNNKVYIKLADFGLSKKIPIKSYTTNELILKTDSNLTQEIGTELYASPEQLNGNYDITSDIYSLGLVICYIMTSIKKRDIILIENFRKKILDKSIPKEVIYLLENEPKNRFIHKNLLCS